MRGEFEEYRNNVEQHFAQSSLLFNQLTENYQQLYTHLNSGMNQLVKTSQFDQLTDLSEEDERLLQQQKLTPSPKQWADNQDDRFNANGDEPMDADLQAPPKDYAG